MSFVRTDIIAVVIGRNEGDRLLKSLRSVQEAALPVVYADSASEDGSPQVATDFGIPVVYVSKDRPLSAGRGRNEGLQEALRRWPAAQFVLFLDGDCTLVQGFVSSASAVLEADKLCAIVVGMLAERHPNKSIYNRLCSAEWKTPVGPMTDVNSLGGIMLVRISAFAEAGGFHLDAIAGEEPDLGARLMLRGYRIIKIDKEMAVHDAEMMRLGQWWKRSVRSGHALAFRFANHGFGELRDGRRAIASDLFWGFALPLASICMATATNGISLLALLSYAVLYDRARRGYLARGVSENDARLIGGFIILDKFAHVVGIVKFLLNSLRGEFKIIEYK